MRTLALMAALLVSSSALAQTPRDCNALWKEADSDGNGSLSKQEDKFGYFDAFRATGRKTVAPDVISRDEFVTYCEGSLSKASATKPGDGAAGSVDRGKGDLTPALIPFPKHEALKRIEATGYREVAELVLDEKGIWRTTAMFNGKRVPIAVDGQGDILAGG